MIVKIKATGRIICKDLKIAESFLDRMLGLLISKNPRSLLFKTRFGIHTFLLKEEIDVVILDNRFQVAKIKSKLKPNRLFFWNPKHSFVLELPRGFIKKFDISQTQKLEIC